MPDYVKDGYANWDTNEIELVYWRKSWGIRLEIAKILEFDVHNNNTSITIERQNIPAIIEILKRFINVDYWNDNADSIWEYDEDIEDILKQQIVNLEWLYCYAEEHSNEIEIIFYNSY